MHFSTFKYLLLYFTNLSFYTILLYPLTRLTRELLVVYLDEDLLVVRDYLGSPEILRRVGKVEDVTVINSEIITVN